MLPQILANPKLWCTSRQDKMIIGIRLHNIIENYINWNKRRQSKRKCLIKPNWEDFFMTKCSKSREIVTKNYRVTVSIWMICKNSWDKRKKLLKKNRIRRNDTCNRSIKRGLSNSKHCLASGKMIENKLMTTTMKSWNRIRKRKLKNKVLELNYSKLDFKLPRKMLNDSINQRLKPRYKEIKRKLSSRH